MSRTTNRDRNESGLFLFFDNLKSLLGSVVSFEEQSRSQGLSVEEIDEVVDRLNVAADTLQLLITDIDGNDAFADVAVNLNTTVNKVRRLSNILQQYKNNTSASAWENSYNCPIASTENRPGRPHYVIGEEQIRFLRELHFSWVKIASLLGVSESTLRRRRILYGMTTEEEPNWAMITDDELERTVREIQELTPNIGQARLLGALRSRGLNIQRRRVRNCLRSIDPIGTALRWRSPIYRRKYSVPTPNALWHIDGNHKLTRWRLVVHLCIDGYSRLIIYAHCCNNNKASTVLNQFIEGVTPMDYRRESEVTMVWKISKWRSLCYNTEALEEEASLLVVRYTTPVLKGLTKMFTLEYFVSLQEHFLDWKTISSWTPSMSYIYLHCIISISPE